MSAGEVVSIGICTLLVILALLGALWYCLGDDGDW